MLTPLAFVASLLWARLQQMREDDRGMTTEAMIITAMLAAAAIAAVGLIATAIQDKGSEIEGDINGAMAFF
jgi:hypothetical protein